MGPDVGNQAVIVLQGTTGSANVLLPPWKVSRVLDVAKEYHDAGLRVSIVLAGDYVTRGTWVLYRWEV